MYNINLQLNNFETESLLIILAKILEKSKIKNSDREIVKIFGPKIWDQFNNSIHKKNNGAIDINEFRRKNRRNITFNECNTH